MRGAAVVALAWAALLLLLAGGLAVWSGGTPALLLVAGSLPIVVAALAHQFRGPRGPERRLPRASASAIALAVGPATAAVGLTAGLWLVLFGAQVTLVGIVLLWRELSSERKLGP